MNRTPARSALAATLLIAAMSCPAPAVTASPLAPATVGDWTQLLPVSSSPTPRREHCAIYDPANDRMIVYGGALPGGVTDTQTWQFQWSPAPSWSVLPTTHLPPAVRGMSAIYDPVRNRMIVFGGDLGGSSLTNGVWALPLDHPTAWQNIVTQGSPPDPRMFAVVVYDSAADRMIVFGGYPNFNDTWALSLAEPPTWARIVPTSGSIPAGRWSAAGSYDPVHQSLVVYSGGYPQTTTDAWTLSLSGSPVWQQLAAQAVQPPGLVASTGLYDPNGPSMLVYGGLSSGGNIADTWALSLQGTPSWSILSHGTPLPPTRRFHTSVYRSLASQMIMYGGFDDNGQTFRGDVWSLQLSTGPGPPVISGFEPLGGSVGDSVTVSGDHLATTTSVRFNGVEAGFVVRSDLAVQAAVPSGATTGPIIVTTPLGSDTTSTDFFVGVAPFITAAVPDSAHVGDTVQLFGINFTNATRVSFGGLGAAAFTVMSDGLISATLDSLATTGPVRVTTPTGSGTSAFSFLVLQPNPRPRLQQVHDVPFDEGGRVVLRWLASDYDGPRNHTVTAYRVWRRAPLFALRAGAHASPAVALAGLSIGTPPQFDTEFWENLADVPAALLAGYAYTAPTLSDSAAAGNPFTAFVIEALTSDRTVFYFSNIDSGYSVDNLAPSSPASFAAVVRPAGVALHWKPNTESDFATYRIYRGQDPAFVPGPSSIVATAPDTGYFDAGAGGGNYYKITATDVHGNASRFATASTDMPVATLVSLATAEVVAGTVRLAWQALSFPGQVWTLQRSSAGAEWRDVRSAMAGGDGAVSFEDADVKPGAHYAYRIRGIVNAQPFVSPEVAIAIPAMAFALESAGPNPLVRADLVVTFTLPDAAAARLELLDVTGRRIDSREVGSLGGGRHHLRLAAASQLRAGVHFVRLTRGSQVVTSRIAILK